MDSFVQKSIKIIELLQKAAKDDTSEVASIAVCDGDYILMGKRRDNGRWTMPGGHLDKGEEKADGAVRELFEESGIKVEPNDLKYLGSKDVVTHKGKKKLIHAFKYKHEGERPTTKHDPDKEVEKWEWIDCSKGIPKEVSENAHTPVDKNIVFEKMDLKPEEDLQKFQDVQGSEKKDPEPLFKPYRSDAQRRWAHSPTGKKALGGEAAVHEWDTATKGKKLPEKVLKKISADQESEKIKENKKKPAAHVEHKFKAAEWTHPNGHPRCIICGDEERTGGMCSGLKKSEDLQKAPLPYNGFEQLAPEAVSNLKDPEDKKTTKKIKEVALPNGLIYRQYADHNPDQMSLDEMDSRSGRRAHALFHPDHPTPLAIMETAHEHNAMAPKGMYPHKVDIAEVDKDFRGKGLGRQLYLATLVHGTKQLTSDSRTSNDANNAWKSFRGLPGLGGKIGRSPKPGELLFRPGLADSYEEDRHQLHIKDPKALDHNKMFPKIDLFDKLAASEKKVDLTEIKRLLEAPQETETMDIPEHLQMQWATPYHRWGR